MRQDNRYGVPPIRAKREPIRRDDMAIYQAGTNDAPGNSVVTFSRTFERTGLYNLLSATPLIAWYGFAAILQRPSLAHQIASLDLATADARILAGLASKLATQVFFITLALLLVLRRKPLGKASGFYPRFAAIAGMWLGAAIVLLPVRELSVPLNVASTLLILCGVVFALYAVLWLGRSFSVMPEARRVPSASERVEHLGVEAFREALV